jgi:hypothetical protein
MTALNDFHSELKEKLNEYGYSGNDLCEAKSFLEIKINEYWVDCPPKFRDEEAKEYAKKCSALKKLEKGLKAFVKAQNLKFVFDETFCKYFLK